MAKENNIITSMRGIIPSLHTPFSKDNKIDLCSLKKLIDHTISTGCAGMLVGAVAGENSSLSINEKKLIIKESIRYNGNRIPTIVSCSAKEQKDRIALSILAKEAGAEWILCQVPDNVYGDELLECFQQIAEEGPKYLMIQDLSWTDNGMRDEDILMLYNKIKKFKGLKIEVLNAGPKYTRVLEATNNEIHLSGGWAIMGMMEALHRGVHAFIPSTMEILYNRIYNLFVANKFEEAKNLFYEMLPTLSFAHQHIDISIKFYKTLRVKEEIFATNFCRSPIKDFDKFQNDEAERHINKIFKLQNNLLNN
ncbi:dihydrodipicolinate synthase family protein [Alphaproteobacteria bacterium]|nr:dihydrodipicolinate synthase family protein [Alphaproteobacteria bacterium]